MARTVKPDEFAAKRGEILDAAQRLVITKGYQQMVIQDILNELHISSGAFHHYFDSRGALLGALIERMQQEAEQPLLPIVQDPHLPALEKFRHFFATLDRSRSAQKTFLTRLARAWYAYDNAVVRQKVDETIVERRTPMLSVIIRQGIQEEVFSTPYPDQLSKVILSLTLSVGSILARLMRSAEQGPQRLHNIEVIVATYAAYTDTIERALGVSARFLYRPDAEAVKEWLVAQADGDTR